MKYLVTGRAGSGKTSVHHELVRRGINSIDMDVTPGLARWEDPITSEPVRIDTLKLTDTTTAKWNWNPDKLQKILSKPDALFLCGSSDNQLEFHRLFRYVFVLGVSPEIQRQRLIDREHNYGKNQRLQDAIIKEQAEFLEQAVKLGAIVVNSERPVEEVVDEILGITDEASASTS